MLFTDALTSPESLALVRNRLAHPVDIQPLGTRSKAVLLNGLHEYADAHLVSYFLPPDGSLAIPRNDPPQRFVFLPEFTACRLLVRPDGADWLRLSLERGLKGAQPPAEAAPDSPYLDSFGYWEHTSGLLVGVIRATAVLIKEQDQPWTILMQQIVGSAGAEVVRLTVFRPLRY